MKFLIFILAILSQQINCQETVCDTCGRPPFIGWPSTFNCICPKGSNKTLVEWQDDVVVAPSDDANARKPVIIRRGHCCDFKDFNCKPKVVCPQNKHVVCVPASSECECACNNLGLLKCKNLNYASKSTCECKCPSWASKSCTKKEYFDSDSCSCKSRESRASCTDCEGTQKWNSNTLTCECPQVVCKHPLYLDHSTCTCKCKQQKRDCCPSIKPKKIWNEKKCNCVCLKQHCPPHYHLHPYTCECIEDHEPYTGQ